MGGLAVQLWHHKNLIKRLWRGWDGRIDWVTDEAAKAARPVLRQLQPLADSIKKETEGSRPSVPLSRPQAKYPDEYDYLLFAGWLRLRAERLNRLLMELCEVTDREEEWRRRQNKG